MIFTKIIFFDELDFFYATNGSMIPVAVVIAYNVTDRKCMHAFAQNTMQNIKTCHKDAVLIAVEQLDIEPPKLGTLFNLAVRHVRAERYVFHHMQYSGAYDLDGNDDDDIVMHKSSCGGLGAVWASRSALTAVNGFPNDGDAEFVFRMFEHRISTCKLRVSSATHGTSRKLWNDSHSREESDNGQAGDEHTGVEASTFEQGLWTASCDKLMRSDETNAIVLSVAFKREFFKCLNCNYACTNIHASHCCLGCERGGMHDLMCAKIETSRSAVRKRKVFLGLFGLYRNFEKTAPTLLEKLIKHNEDCEFTLSMHTSVQSRSRRDRGFDGGPVRVPRLRQCEIERRLREAYERLGTIESIVFDDETHFKFHPGHEGIHRDKDEPITYRILSLFQNAKGDHDVYMFLRFDVEPCAPISLADYDENTFRIISSSGRMNCFFHNRNWDFCWVGGRNAMRNWLYPVREFSTWTERGRHRDVSSGVPGLEAWVSKRDAVLDYEECVDILKAVNAKGNDVGAAWIETHSITGQKTVWSSSDARGPDGFFVSAAGKSWTAEFRDGLFYPNRPECLHNGGVSARGPFECVAPKWCHHGSTFTFVRDLHWRSEQYCRIIKNMRTNGCSFGFRDANNEFFNLRRD